LARSILSAVVQFHNQTAGKPLDLLTDTIPGQKGNESVASNPADTEVEVKLSGIDPSRQEMYSKSLIVIDGAVMGNLNRPALNKMINIADIQSINVWKGDAAIKRYGDKGKYGVVEIITKKNNKESVTRELSLKEVAENPTENKIFEKVEIEPAFPGGNTGWQKYLEKNLDLHVAETNQAQSGTYTVYVVFIVHKDGSISDIKPLTHHGFGMEEEAIRVISGGPKWIPAVQNGWKVNAYKKQPVTFIVNRAKDAKVVPE
jgi:hypothetical protein